MGEGASAAWVFRAAPLDGEARFRVIAVFVVLSPTPVLGVMLLWGIFQQEGVWAALLALVVVFLLPLGPIAMVGMLPTSFEVDGDVLRVHTRWFGVRSFVHEGRAEPFRDTEALRRRGFFSSGRPRFNRIVTATMGLPPGKVYFALTDRERAVLVPYIEGSLLVSPDHPSVFCRAVTSSAAGRAGGEHDGSP